MVTAVATHPYVDALLKGCEMPPGGVSWLDERRARALERTNALTVPTTRDEEWRFTDITPLTRLQLRPAAAASLPAMADIAPFIVPEATAHLVFVDGIFAPELPWLCKPAAIRQTAARARRPRNSSVSA